MQECCTHSVSTCLGSFGAYSVKPLTIFCSNVKVADLKRKRPPAGAKGQLVTKKGSQVTGIRKKLQSSQAYPNEFGKRVAEIMVDIAVEAQEKKTKRLKK